MGDTIQLALAGLISGGVVAAVVGYVLQRKLFQLTQEIRHGFERQESWRYTGQAWKEQALSEVLGPMFMHLQRIRKARSRWQEEPTFRELQVLYKSQHFLRDLLLAKGHLIPKDLFSDSSQLMDYFDRWIEEFEAKVAVEHPELESRFVFTGPRDRDYPQKSEDAFVDKFKDYRLEVYGSPERSRG